MTTDLTNSLATLLFVDSQLYSGRVHHRRVGL